jgi:hypothetical protein
VISRRDTTRASSRDRIRSALSVERPDRVDDHLGLKNWRTGGGVLSSFSSV